MHYHIIIVFGHFWGVASRVLMSALETTISQLLNKILMIQKHFHKTENEILAYGYVMNKLNN